MKPVTVLKMVVVLATCLAAASFSFADQEKEQAARAVAEDYLRLVDSGRYAESWEVSANFFKNLVPKARWVGQLKEFRPPLGRVLNREVLGAQYTQSLPGAPEGHYVVVRFATAFDNQPEALETVTPMLESDGLWRVSGYYIH